jgi:3'-5' exonuclease
VNRRRPEYLVLDIETVPDDSRWARPEAPHGVEAPFPPTWAHRVIVVGCLWLDADYRLRRLGVIDSGPPTPDADTAEAQLLESFSRFVGRQRPALVTYNGRAFDLPVIALRSLCHGVPLAWYYQERGVRYRYSEEGHIDLCDWLADHGATRSGSLDAIARLCGLPGKVGVDGSQVAGLHQTGQLAAIQRYCLADVAQTAFVFLRFRLLQGQLAAAAYREATTALWAELERDGRVDDVLAGIDRERLLAARGPDLAVGAAPPAADDDPVDEEMPPAPPAAGDDPVDEEPPPAGGPRAAGAGGGDPDDEGSGLLAAAPSHLAAGISSPRSPS